MSLCVQRSCGASMCRTQSYWAQRRGCQGFHTEKLDLSVAFFERDREVVFQREVFLPSLVEEGASQCVRKEYVGVC